ncbi:ABC transporter permease [Streptomyces albidochromogenes]|uniref:ABC transporter permease n=1 Tax=Streptomyces albidochromogenes TaxID=329524 RepID=UPI00110FB5F4|nr:ABC transporter permease [Streptomyces albidochromogenes]
MPTAAALRSEWLKIMSMRSVVGSLAAVFVVTLCITVLVSAAVGRSEARHAGFDPVFGAFHAVNFGQIAAIAFGTLVVSAEYANGALRTSLAAVPDRSRFYAAKMALVAGPVLAVGLVTGFVSFLAGQAFMGEYAMGLGHPGVLRACVGSAVYLALMALLAAGLTTLFRSGVAVLSLLIPFVLIVSFVLGDVAEGIAAYLPDRAGQLVIRARPTGSLGPWTGLAVTAGWAATAVLAGRWALLRRDA